MTKLTFEFTASAPAERLDAFLTEQFDASDCALNVTRSYVKQLISDGAVLNAFGVAVTKPSQKVREGDRFSVTMEEPKPLTALPENIPLNIVAETADYVVINKQKGLVVHPCDTAPEHTLVNALLYHIKDLSSINGVVRPGIVHRLDKDTTGLLVVAKNDAAHLSLQRQIQQKTAERRYLAIVDRNIKEDSGIIDFPLDRNPKNRLQMTFAEAGRAAVTHFFVKERFGDFALVEFVLETGRTHQIRAHAKLIGHPVTGDEVYGGSQKFKTNGQLLHAYRLSFDDPTTAARVTYEAELPEEFSAVLNKLKKG